ncbi:membrane protein required for colicin V production [Pseudooceanicola antarcticus]|uniref:Colicin V production CvpA n=1 Tax=Pseudooceanicola antarcticus TaxID=1247613 RepID=A0A285J1Z3_9RHOB|nr:CvpA family protein [Pseudooceanicola antarcticus]PJE29817.1 colicin V production CvpA [Pseudooceanicola antarcticus]SNY54238.1 membrane protein required for colicin V production [Pseudooceanicola antarcticus]
MEGFTLIDGIVAAIVLISAILAYSRGFVRECLAIVGWILAAVVAFIFAPDIQPLVKEIPVVGDMLAGSCELTIIAAFGVLFALALAIASLFTPAFASVVQRSVLGGIDQAAGFLFGVVRGVLLIAVGFFVYKTMLTSQSVEMVDNSRSAAVFAKLTTKIEEEDPEQALGWITEKYEELASTCTAEG